MMLAMVMERSGTKLANFRLTVSAAAEAVIIAVAAAIIARRLNIEISLLRNASTVLSAICVAGKVVDSNTAFPQGPTVLDFPQACQRKADTCLN